MSMEPEVIEAIYEAVASEGQAEVVARQIIAWLNEMSERDMSKGEHEAKLTLLLSSLELRRWDSHED